MNEAFAKFFYDQCAGTFAGHMGMVPNNPTLFGLVRAHTGTQDSHYAASRTNFAAMLRDMAEALEPLKKEPAGRSESGAPKSLTASETAAKLHEPND